MNITPPPPYGAIPAIRQLNWHQNEFYGFIHFSPNTFTDREWGYGDEDPSIFNPTNFNADQIVKTAESAGMKGLILTCKHHDGFCLWPSKYTEHSVKNSPWKDGKGDIVREISESCYRNTMRFGVYLSPWDRNHADYGFPEYLEYFRKQLTELLTEYGKIFEVWFDGANGGDGYYGGARESRHINRVKYYDWENTWALVRQLQPEAAIFSDVGPDIRWIGNESGYALYPCWSTYTPAGIDGQTPAPGLLDYEAGMHGHENGELWLPAEVDVSIRPGWFYHAHEDNLVKTPEELLKCFDESIGRGTSFLLNLPPDRRGQIHENDVAALKEFRQHINESFAHNLMKSATVSASGIRSDNDHFAPSNIISSQMDTYWSVNNDTTNAGLIIQFPECVVFNTIILQENIALGQRIREFRISIDHDGSWEVISHQKTIGFKRIVRLENTQAEKLRIDFAGNACPVISHVSIYHCPPLKSRKNKEEKGIDKRGWTILNDPSAAAFNRDSAIMWKFEDTAHQCLDIHLGGEVAVSRFAYTPHSESPDGLIEHYQFHVSNNAEDFGEAVHKGRFDNIRNNPVRQMVILNNVVTGSYIRFEALSTVNDAPAVIADFDVFA